MSTGPVRLAQLGPVEDPRPLLAPANAALVGLLAGLEPDEWLRPTAAPGWTVKDVAAHVLQDHLRRVASLRDGWHGPGPAGGEPLAAAIHRENGDWVRGARFLGPRQLVELIERAGREADAAWAALDPDAPSVSVSWAGVDPAPVRLDAAREYTEHWVHQRQIRDAVGRPGLDGAEFVAPVLATFLCALPFTLRGVAAPDGTRVRVGTTDPVVVRDVTRHDGGWWLGPGREPGAPAAEVELDGGSLWRLCVRAIEPADAARRAQVSGDTALAAAVLEMVSIIR
jgi:uncharacterized protein (TIGR03083 family)